MKGEVQILGKSVWDYNFMKISKNVGLVKQNPLEQLVTFTVRDEIAFGLENLKYSKRDINKKIQDVAEFMGIADFLDRDINQLSGGQKQLTILSSFLVMEPKILILDEPIAFLDQNSESLLLNRLKHLIKSGKYDLSLVIIEHRLSRVLDIADKLLILNEQGGVALYGTASEIIHNEFNTLRTTNVRIPWILEAFNAFNQKYPNTASLSSKPSTYHELSQFIDTLDDEELETFQQVLTDHLIEPSNLRRLERYEEKIEFKDVYLEQLREKNKLEYQEGKKKGNQIILETENLNFVYPNSAIKALTDLNLKIYEGDFIGLVGPNGCGKTTLLYTLARLYEPTSGIVKFKGRDIQEVDPYEYAKNIGFIFQNPENMIFKTTLRDEILYAPTNFGTIDQINDLYLQKLIALVGDEPAEKNPFNLSWGQKRRLNLSSVFVYNPDIILLDEPFIGQDQKTIDAIVETLYIENKRGKTILISSHDYHLLLKYTRRIVELGENGTLQDYDTKRNYFSRHQSLGPMALFNKISAKLGGQSK